MTIIDRIRLAWFGLSRRPVRTGLTSLGIAVAVSSMVIFLSLGEGLRQTFLNELSSVGPDIQVTHAGTPQGLLPPPILNPETSMVIGELAAGPGIVQVTPVVVNLKQALNPADSAVYYGLPTDQGVQALFPGVRTTHGRLLQVGDAHLKVAVLGAKAARNLKVQVGGLVMLNRWASVRVVGILAPENSLTDTFTFLPLSVVQAAFGLGNRISMVALRLDHPERVQQVASTLAGCLHVTATTCSELFRFVGRMLNSVDVISLGLSVIALAVGGLAVVNTVMMGVQERTQEFGTLRAIGARPAAIRGLVLTESLLVSLIGGALGLLLGWLGTLGINVYTEHLAGIAGAALTLRLVLLTLAVSLLLGALAGALPARNAGRMTIHAALGQA